MYFHMLLRQTLDYITALLEFVIGQRCLVQTLGNYFMCLNNI